MTQGYDEAMEQQRQQQRHDFVENVLSYHPVRPDTQPVFEQNREMVKHLSHTWIDTLPEGRHAALAQTALQEALMWANAAVAIDTPVPAPEQTG